MGQIINSEVIVPSGTASCTVMDVVTVQDQVLITVFSASHKAEITLTADQADKLGTMLRHAARMLDQEAEAQEYTPCRIENRTVTPR